MLFEIPLNSCCVSQIGPLKIKTDRFGLPSVYDAIDTAVKTALAPANSPAVKQDFGFRSSPLE